MRGVMASPALAKAQAAGLAELRDALMSHWPRAGSTPPPPPLSSHPFWGSVGATLPPHRARPRSCLPGLPAPSGPSEPAHPSPLRPGMLFWELVT